MISQSHEDFRTEQKKTTTDYSSYKQSIQLFLKKHNLDLYKHSEHDTVNHTNSTGHDRDNRQKLHNLRHTKTVTILIVGSLKTHRKILNK